MIPEKVPKLTLALEEKISAVPLGGGSCIGMNLLVGVDMARGSRADKKLVIYMGDGGGTCSGLSELVYLQQTLAEVEERNGGEVTIHCVHSRPRRWLGADFLSKLSGPTGGTVIALPEAE